MKLKHFKHTISGPSHIEHIWKLCLNKRKVIEFTYETTPHGYCNSLLLQIGGDAWFYKSLSLGNYMITFSFLPYC